MTRPESSRTGGPRPSGSFDSFVAQTVGARTRELVEVWLEQLQAHLRIRPESVFPTHELLDHMPEVISWVSRSIAGDEELSSSGLDALRNLAIHWREAGFSVEESLLHFRMLSRILHDALQEIVGEYEDPVDPRIVAAIAERTSSAIDLAQIAIVATYRDEEEERFEEFAGTMVHQVRDPVARGLSSLSTLAMLEEEGDVDADARRRLVAHAARSLEHLEEMIQTVQQLSRRRALPPETLEHRPLREAVGSIVQEFREKASGDVELTCEEPLPDVSVPAQPVHLVLHNLVMNAVEYADHEKPRPCVTVRADHDVETGRCTVAVEDNGIGMSEAEQKHVFDRFQRGSGAKGSGFGLGLSIVRETVSRIGGEVHVRSRPGVGSTFTFTLPAAEAPGAADQPASV